MDLTIRRGGEKEWGFVESFDMYHYDGKGSVKVTIGVSTDGNLTKPYVLRKGVFIPLDVIDKEMGVEKYIKAKKPFYSLLSDGFVASVKAGVDFNTGEFLPDKTDYKIYQLHDMTKLSLNQGTIHLRQIHETSKDLEDLMMVIAEKISRCKGDRLEFLKARL